MSIWSSSIRWVSWLWICKQLCFEYNITLFEWTSRVRVLHLYKTDLWLSIIFLGLPNVTGNFLLNYLQIFCKRPKPDWFTLTLTNPVGFDYIGRIVDHHCQNFHFRQDIWSLYTTPTKASYHYREHLNGRKTNYICKLICI